MKLLIGECPHFSRFALPDESSFVLARSVYVAIEAVIREIDLAADEPLRPGIVPFKDLVPLLEPVQLRGDPGPEFFRFLNRFAVNALVVFRTLDVCAATKSF